jgi:hypothetical protein
MSVVDRPWSQTGPYFAESIVMAELAKRQLYTIRLPPQFGFDLFADNGARVEVKSARLSKSGWSFSLGHSRETKWVAANNLGESKKRQVWRRREKVRGRRPCDFYAFVGFDIGGADVMEFFIVPEALVGDKLQIQASSTRGRLGGRISLLERYRRRWDLIVDFRDGRFRIKAKVQAGAMAEHQLRPLVDENGH